MASEAGSEEVIRGGCWSGLGSGRSSNHDGIYIIIEIQDSKMTSVRCKYSKSQKCCLIPRASSIAWRGNSQDQIRSLGAAALKLSEMSISIHSDVKTIMAVSCQSFA
jgi:hypothetical protein